MNTYEYILTADGELYHWGVKGQKWGVRRYQNPDGSLTDAGRKRQARRYTKELNKLDKERAEAFAESIRRDNSLQGYKRAEGKLTEKYAYDPSDRNAKKLSKNAEGMAKATARLNEQRAKVKAIEKYTSNKVNEMISNGYDVRSKEVIRNTKMGEQFCAQYMGGIIGYGIRAGLEVAETRGRYKTTNSRGQSYDQTPWMVSGTKYKVRN